MVNKVKRPSIILDSSWWNEQTFSNIDNETHVLQLLLCSSYKLKQIRRNSVKKQKITVQQLSWGLWCWWVGIVHSWCAYSTRQSSALHDGSLDHPETHQQKEFSSLVAWFLDQIEGTVVTFVFSSWVVELCRVVTRSVWETQLMRVVFGLDWAFDAEEGLLGLYRCSTSLMEYQYC